MPNLEPTKNCLLLLDFLTAHVASSTGTTLFSGLGTDDLTKGNT
jgi:hypothetical protein